MEILPSFLCTAPLLVVKNRCQIGKESGEQCPRNGSDKNLRRMIYKMLDFVAVDAVVQSESSCDGVSSHHCNVPVNVLKLFCLVLYLTDD